MGSIAAAAWEWTVLAAFVGVSAGVPLWAARRSAAPLTKTDYVFATDSAAPGSAKAGVSLTAMVLSVARGSLGVRCFLGFPAELVYRGSGMWETVYGMALSLPLVCLLFVPVYFSLGVTSVYEYLEMRFGSAAVRRLTAAIFLLRQVLNLAVTAYTPAVALNAALGVPPIVSISVLVGLSALLALLGGLGAAVRADAIQTGAMIAVSVVLLSVGSHAAGGPLEVLKVNRDGGRLQFFKFTGDLHTRVDTLSALLGQLFMSLSLYGCQQTYVQRYCSMRSQRRVAWILGLSAPAVAAMFSLSWLVGMAVYAVYAHCDPLAGQRIGAPDEVLPLFLHDYLEWLPGALGVFLGCLFNGALSFLVTNLNSLATVTWEDFVSAAPPFRGLPDAQQLFIIKIISVIYAMTIGALACGVGMAAGVVEASLLATSVTAGPLLGVFLLAVFLPHVEAVGAASGMVVSLALVTWLGVGRLITVPADTSTLPLRTDGCENNTYAQTTILSGRSADVNRTLHLLLWRSVENEPTPPPPPWSHTLYSVSYMWYAVFGTIVCVLVATCVSACVRGRPRTIDPRLVHPVVRRFLKTYSPTPPSIVSETTVNVIKTDSPVTSTTICDDKSKQDVLTDSRLFDAYSSQNHHNSSDARSRVWDRGPAHTNGHISHL